MIHLLKVGPTLTVKDFKRQMRKFAMTGGVEVGLEDELSYDDLEKIVEIYLPELNEYEPGVATRYSCGAYRVLKLVAQQEDLPSDTKLSLEEELAK